MPLVQACLCSDSLTARMQRGRSLLQEKIWVLESLPGAQERALGWALLAVFKKP